MNLIEDVKQEVIVDGVDSHKNKTMHNDFPL